MISPKQLAALGWYRTNAGQAFAFYEHVQGWQLRHCCHPTALYPFTLYNPAGQAIAAPNGRNFQTASKAVEWLAAKYPETIPPRTVPDPPLPLFDAQFVHVGCVIMRGAESIARARSKTMAKRIANALNSYTPNREGV